MHIAIAAHDLYPDPGSGGTGRYVHETAVRFVRRGHPVSVLTRRRGDVPATETVDGVDVHRYDVSIAGRSGAEVVRQLPGVCRAVRDRAASIRYPTEPDLVSFQGPVTSLLLDRYAPDRVPRIATFHSPWPREYGIRTRGDAGPGAVRRWFNARLRSRLERRVLARSDHVVALSEFMRRELARTYEPGTATRVVPGGVDAERFAPDAGAFPPMDVDGPAFLTVRRLSPRMGHDLLLSAFAGVREEFPDARLFVAGDGPLRESLERTAASLGVREATTFLGYVPDDDLPRAYATADAFVLPTRELEGFGLATLEALSSATPVVATPVGGTREVLGEVGTACDLPVDPLVAGVDPDLLAAGMCAWATLPESRRRAAGLECRAYVRNRFSWDRTVAALADLYAEHAQ